MQIKKGDVSFNLAFKNGEYTNKLFGRSFSLNQAGGANQLEVDFSHYAKRKRNNLEDCQSRSKKIPNGAVKVYQLSQ